MIANDSGKQVAAFQPAMSRTVVGNSASPHCSLLFWESGDMPDGGGNNIVWRSKRLAEAKRQVQEKFPKLLVGSSGWVRAVENRLRRVRL